jgi:tetratricopeptide (TPR) repeat protein
MVHGRRRRAVDDRTVALTVMMAALLPAFGITRYVVGQYKGQRLGLAADWSQRGDRDLSSQPAAAVADYETALSYGGDASTDRLHLSQALIAAHRPAEARAHLLTLWNASPGSGVINLELARLAAAGGDVAGASRYYHAAIDGAWDANAITARRGARLELARFLLANELKTPAQAELIAVSDDLPPDPELITEVGRLLVQAGADPQALTLFQRVLTIDPKDAAASVLSGQIAYRAGDYRSAQQSLSQAAKSAPLDDESRNMLDVSGRVLALDPAAVGLRTRTRLQRTLDGLTAARSRLERCEAGQPDSTAKTQIDDLAARLAPLEKTDVRRLTRDPDLSDDVLAFVFDVETLNAAACGTPTVDDQALRILAERRRRTPGQ